MDTVARLAARFGRDEGELQVVEVTRFANFRDHDFMTGPFDVLPIDGDDEVIDLYPTVLRKKNEKS